MLALMLAFAVTLVTLCIVAVGASRIVDYRVTAVTAQQAAQFPWAAYDTSVAQFGSVSNASYEDDSTVFDDTGYTMPYFQHDALPWYISSNGFLSPSDSPVCSSYCQFAFGQSPYQQSASGAAGISGTYPSIQLFSGDLNPAAGPPAGKIYKRLFTKNVSGELLAVANVAFDRIPRYSQSNSLASSDYLTAQVELWPNGTIIFRYQSRIAQTSFATIGLAWTARQRVYLNGYPTAVAIRLDPVLDTCNVHLGCEACFNASCTWCGSLSLCVNTSVVDDYCPLSQRDECNVSNAFVGQRYYQLTQTTQPPMAEDTFFGIAGEAIPGAVVFTSPQWANLSDPIDLPFSPIGMFYNPPIWNTSDYRVRSEVLLTAVGMLSLLGTTQSCADSGYCANGQYHYTLLGVAGFNVFASNQTVVEIGELPPNRTSPFCGVDAKVNGSCPAAVVIRVVNVSYGIYQPLKYSYTMLIDSLGRLGIRYDRGSVRGNTTMPFIGWPAPSFGLIRDGLTDMSSVAVPWGSVTVGTSLVFRLLPTCVDCGVGGRCNMTSRECTCKENFLGTSCEQCRAGYYGSACTPCPDCGADGTCDDGRSGFGGCICAAPYSGRRCEVKCDAPPYTCTSCSGQGGYCECGRCICNATRGWHGTNCSQWSDPCFALSLDGCPVCTANAAVLCQYCSTSAICVANPLQDGIGQAVNFSSCSVPFQTGASSACANVRQLTQPANTTAIIFVLLTFGALGFVACLLFTCICACKKRRMNVLSMHAVTGTPNFKFPRREREVVQMVLVPFQGRRGKPVMGIPLKQVQLKELYQLQQEKRKRDQMTHHVRDWDASLCREE